MAASRPKSPDVIAGSLRLLAHLGDHWIARDRREEAVDVDRPEAFGEGDVLLRRQLLIAEEHDSVLPQDATGLGDGRARDRARQIDAGDLAADIPRNRRDREFSHHCDP